MLSYRELLKAQRVEWPNSVRLTSWQVVEWAHNAPNNEERLTRFMQIGTAIQYPRVMFYLTANGNVGARFGLRPEEYISGFNSKAVELFNDKLIDTDRPVW